jgi:hypothetical protein
VLKNIHPATTGSAASTAATTPADAQLLATACLQLPLDEQAKAVLVHLRAVGLMMSPLSAQTDTPGAFQNEGSSANLADGHVFRTTSTRGATLSFGGSQLNDQYNITVEGSFGAGAALRTTLDNNAQLDFPITGALNGFSPTFPQVSVAANISVVDTSGTNVRIGRVFALPFGLPPSCDLVVPLLPKHRTDLQFASDTGAAPINGMSAAVANIVPGPGNTRTATIVVANFQQEAGVPLYELFDWVEQYPEEPEQPDCPHFQPRHPVLDTTASGASTTGTTAGTPAPTAHANQPGGQP